MADYGRFVGARVLDVIVLREKGYKRETRLLNMLMFVKTNVWRNLFNKEADKLERSNDDPCTCKYYCFHISRFIYEYNYFYIYRFNYKYYYFYIATVISRFTNRKRTTCQHIYIGTER